ncbi:unnamed protein product [Clavelina lepadiformis]|uniref:Fibrillar collagen NC1 domain-containing protein n=1 Tax=Clavelina lepadiformis TaxID=159417 RepID=A0ABP0FFU4_CLALP
MRKNFVSREVMLRTGTNVILLQMMLALKELTSSVETLKAPRGADRKSPARSCMDIYLAETQQGNVPKDGSCN